VGRRESALLARGCLLERILTNQRENAVFGTPVVYGPHWGHNRLTIVYCQLTIVNRHSRERGLFLNIGIFLLLAGGTKQFGFRNFDFGFVWLRALLRRSLFLFRCIAK
jgi:hypothetical protein